MQEAIQMRLLVMLLMLSWAHEAKAEPLWVAKKNGLTVTLHSDDCKLKAVSNLKKRATWEQDGKVIEGCYGSLPPLGMVFFYFADLTVLGIPIPFFERVSGA